MSFSKAMPEAFLVTLFNGSRNNELNILHLQVWLYNHAYNTHVLYC